MSSVEQQLTEEELAEGLEFTFGITAGHAAEIAAAHRRGELPPDAETIPSDVDLA